MGDGMSTGLFYLEGKQQIFSGMTTREPRTTATATASAAASAALS
jgi:hypothetical protein